MPQATAGLDQQIRPRQSDDWMVLSLVSPDGDPNRSDPGLPGEEYRPTALLDQLPAIQALVAALPCDVMAVRLLRLKPHAQVRLHVDRFFGFRYGKLRLHVPIVTSPASRMRFGTQFVHWSAGHLWYGDFSTLHTVENGGPNDRIHLVLDCLLSPGLLRMFPTAYVPADPMLNRIPLASPSPRLAAGHWRLTAPPAALDWTQESTTDSAVPLELPLTVHPGSGVRLRMPSGVTAELRQVSSDEYRIGGCQRRFGDTQGR